MSQLGPTCVLPLAGVITLVAALAFSAAALEPGSVASIQPLDPTGGEIDVERALAFYAVEPGRKIRSAGYEVRLVSAVDAAVELAYPAGEWFLPPPGAYMASAESRTSWRISPFPKLFGYSGEPFGSRGRIASLKTVEAGLVEVPEVYRTQSNAILRLIRADPHVAGDGWAARAMTKRARVADIDGGVLMPAGYAIGALWNESEQVYTALSRPFPVTARKSVVIPLEQPAAKAHLVLVIDRYEVARHEREYRIDAVLVGAAEHRPEVTIPTASRAYFLFYDLKPGPYQVRVASEHPFDDLEIELAAGQIERVDAWIDGPIELSSLEALPANDQE